MTLTIDNEVILADLGTKVVDQKNYYISLTYDKTTIYDLIKYTEYTIDI